MIIIMRFSELEVLHDSKLEGAKAALSRSGIDWPMLCGWLLPYMILVGESCKNKMSNADGLEGQLDEHVMSHLFFFCCERAKVCKECSVAKQVQ